MCKAASCSLARQAADFVLGRFALLRIWTPSDRERSWRSSGPMVRPPTAAGCPGSRTRAGRRTGRRACGALCGGTRIEEGANARPAKRNAWVAGSNECIELVYRMETIDADTRMQRLRWARRRGCSNSTAPRRRSVGTGARSLPRRLRGAGGRTRPAACTAIGELRRLARLREKNTGSAGQAGERCKRVQNEN